MAYLVSKESVMTTEKQNIQDVFLNNSRKQKIPVTVFLVNGVKLQGVIASFDNFSVILKRGPQTQLVYKHAIATVVPGAPVRYYEGAELGDFADDTEDTQAYEEMGA
jgi:host factor-I protein